MSLFEKEFIIQPSDIQKLILSYIDDSVFKVINKRYTQEDFKDFVVNYSHWVKDIIRNQDKTYVFRYAALSGDLNLLQYLDERKFPRRRAFKYAIQNGNIENIAWLTKKCHFCRNDRCFEYAAKNGKLEVLKFLLDHNFRKNEKSFIAAAKYGDLEIMKWMLK